jgi:hypothetical protein
LVVGGWWLVVGGWWLVVGWLDGWMVGWWMSGAIGAAVARVGLLEFRIQVVMD